MQILLIAKEQNEWFIGMHLQFTFEGKANVHKLCKLRVKEKLSIR
jgi:hypothetical protein